MAGFRFATRLGAILIACALCIGAARAAPIDPAAIEAALASQGAFVLGGRPLDRAALQSLYRRHGFAPLWTEARAASFGRALADARSQGLDPGAYDVAAADPVARELLLTDAFLRYASALARGEAAPQDYDRLWRIARPHFDAGQALAAALAGDVAAALSALAPHDPAYARLGAAYRRYSALGPQAWPALEAAPLKRGSSGEAVRALRERLHAEGYLAVPADAAPPVYDHALATAVSRFQEAHGLAVDGVAGRATLAALNVTAPQRAAQIGLNLERWRELPRIAGEPRIEVNAAAATVALLRPAQPPVTMRAIVGAPIHPTPVFAARMTAVVFNPPWKVPASIANREILPLARRDPGYLARQGFVFAGAGGQLVQLPGPKNALGRIKFELPNPDDVYLHDTPDHRLFALARRALSHGCVRVEDARALAGLVLDSAAWPLEAIDAAIAAGKTQSVPPPHPIPVYVLYWTAFVDPDGTVEFRDDVYGRDQRLAAALAARPAAARVALSSGCGTRA